MSWKEKYDLLLSILAQNVQKALELIPEEERMNATSDETKALFIDWFCAHLIAEDKASTYEEVRNLIIKELRDAQNKLETEKAPYQKGDR